MRRCPSFPAGLADRAYAGFVVPAHFLKAAEIVFPEEKTASPVHLVHIQRPYAAPGKVLYERVLCAVDEIAVSPFPGRKSRVDGTGRISQAFKRFFRSYVVDYYIFTQDGIDFVQ